MKKYDVIIVGAGPGGIFSALELTKKDNLNILLVEKGDDIDKRSCPAFDGKVCQRCKHCDITSGWGGAGAFSDGKLILSPEIGGWLSEFIPNSQLENLIDYVDQLYLEFGAPKKEYGQHEDQLSRIYRKAVLAGLTFIPYRIRHIGTERCGKVLSEMRNYLEQKLEIRTKTEISQILIKDNKVTGVRTKKGQEILAKNIIVAPGREGSEWLATEAKRLGVKITNNAVDIGVRVEVPAEIMEPLTRVVYEPKFIYYSHSFEDKVRTFCVNPYGEVMTEIYSDVIIVNGHSYAHRKTENTNFALLVSTTFTEPFKEPIAYGKYIARLANLLGGGIIVQRLGDLQIGHRSTHKRILRSTVTPTLSDATPGDLSFVLPYRYISDILEMIAAMDQVTPGINSRNTLLYGAEVKFYSSRMQLKPNMQTHIKNLYAVGDGAGITRSLVQASISGVLAARNILNEVA